ncbi:NAD(P)H-dependent oxidoreductase [Aneurinibacillus sp. Ricciae_BoGa-3]|uniref:NADPH-dependent FMN reductase n=1 Tax=Aneurinibacillus sp. Ricciae_BoGa-3 TaxID=3022697 RepID=UPI002340AE3A|nr:NAD(P)H-dependent oxidoreductase [Aneurinibacillus sp. Ricciae_BoGa-3]WCK54026.1 NAD(P)H-dependent oxidoreductase [Aneurinibacillus sp. Ricciae_BoGa-3]
MQSLRSELHIVGICGSLRKHSHNLGLLRAFEQELPDNIKFTLADISEIPFFNEDREQPYPEAVLKLKETLDSADALVISSPEYNLSYTGVLKNALEWVSRRSLQTKLAGKPVALIGAAAIGVGVSQSHLRDVMFALNMKVINRPIVQVGYTREKFDSEGNLKDNVTRDLLVQLKNALIDAIVT